MEAGVYMATCYLHSQVGVADPTNLKFPACNDGDFGMVPKKMDCSSWPQLHPGAVESTIDFFVLASEIGHAVRSVNVIGDALAAQANETASESLTESAINEDATSATPFLRCYRMDPATKWWSR